MEHTATGNGKSSNLKAVKSERSLRTAPESAVPVAEQPTTKPAATKPAAINPAATSPPQTMLAAAKARLTMLLQSVRTKTTEIVELATVKAEAAKVQVKDTAAFAKLKASSFVEQASKAATKVAQPFTSRASKALEEVRKARAMALGYAASAQAAAVKEYSRLRSQGLKTFTKETALAGTVVAKDSLTFVRSTAAAMYARTLTSATETVDSTRQSAHSAAIAAMERASSAAKLAKEKTAEVSRTAQAVVKDGKFQATAAGAASGAAALGASGGVTGFAAGGALGAVVGLVPAIFTFGLSIPIGAAIGSGAGLVVGTAVGSATGALGGGAAGYGVYTKRAEIHEGTQKTMAKVGSASDFMKDRAYASAGYMKGKVSEMRARLVRSGTGGTEPTD